MYKRMVCRKRFLFNDIQAGAADFVFFQCPYQILGAHDAAVGNVDKKCRISFTKYKRTWPMKWARFFLSSAML